MSIRLMTEAWKSKMPAGRKLVLLALCDNANDQGECYPSVSMLVEKCSMSERSVFNHIADLEKQGAILRNNRVGRSTVYNIDPCKFCTPANSAPLQPLHPTPATVAPITINEPSIEPSSNHKKKAAPAFELPDWINRVHWDAWHSCAKRKKATDQQKLMAVQKLMAWRDAGDDFAGALENAAVGGWQGLFLPEGRAARQTTKPISFADHDEAKRRRRWEEMTGRKWPTDNQTPDTFDMDESPMRIEA
jgi:hypothetical protein